MTGPLDGVTVVVTRPAAQAGPFLELARAQGATCIAYPTLRIARLAPDADALARLRARTWDWAVYTSTNAVESACAQLPAPLAAHHAAVGRATARALAAHGIAVEATPPEANSEGLLELPQFADLTGRGLLLVKGRGGRELLRDAARARGAEVLELELYERVPEQPDAAADANLAAALDAARPPVVVVTSAEILRNLLLLAPTGSAAALRAAPLLVPGVRVAAAAREAGWTGRIVQASTAEDAAMAAALADAAGSARPAAC